jgi:hypothetical protein
MKKKELVRRIVKDLMERDGTELPNISARDVQSRAKSDHRTSVSIPLIYMVLAELRNKAGAGSHEALAPSSRSPHEPTAIPADADLLASAMVFIQAAGGIGNARRALDKVEELVRPAQIARI